MRLLAVLVFAFVLPAQQPRVKIVKPSPSTVRLGESCIAKIVIEGAAENARPRVPMVTGVILELSGPSVSMFESSFGSRRTIRRSITFDLQITPQKLGTSTIPSIPVRVGDKTYRTQPFTIDAAEDLEGKQHGFLLLEPSADRVYVREPIRFTVDLGVDAGLRLTSRGTTRGGQQVLDIELSAKWLSELPGAVALQAPPPDESVLIVLNQEVQAAQYEEQARDGRKFHRLQFERAFLPSKPGTIELAAPILRFKVATGRVGSGIFGERLRSGTKDLFVYGKPRTIEVVPLPTEGRPASYTNAVGRFAVSARLNESTVKVGASVKLVLTIEGTGNLEFLEPPKIEAVDGFHLLGSTVTRQPDKVVVTYDMTPLAAGVSEVPAIEWSYFDTRPGEERYRDIRTDALPITVVELAESEKLAPLAGESSGAVIPGVDDVFDIKLAESSDPAPLPERPSRGIASALIALPWLLCLALAGWIGLRRRRAADAVGLRSRAAAKTFRHALRAGNDPHAALVTYLADRLGLEDAAVIGPDIGERLERAGIDSELAGTAKSLIDAGVEARYGGTGGVSAEQAIALVEQLEDATIQRVVTPPVALALALAFAASAGAQQPMQDGIAAYRAGDYATASERFSAAAADSRALYNLGNSLYRQGEFARSLVAYERARAGLPRDAQLRANITLVRQKLDLGTRAGEPFFDAVAGLRDSFTARELLWLCVLLNAIVALCLIVFRSRRVLRVLGIVLLIPAVLLAFEVLWWGPTRPPKGIVLAPRTELVAEPTRGLDPLKTLSPGVEVAVLGVGPVWTQVRVQGRMGYVPADAVGVVR